MNLTYAEMSRRLNRLITARDSEWCGIPMPLPGLGLVLEDRNPWKDRVHTMQEIIDGPADGEAPAPDPEPGWRVVNEWHSSLRQGKIVILRHDDGRIDWGIDHDKPKRNRMLLGPLSTFDAWHLDTELTAIDKLATLLPERMFQAYVLTGSFLETSKRSGLSYLFRRCRPTVAMTPRGNRRDPTGGMRILACLCLHPIGYYANTFGGAMVPTDDVIAHLMLMRGDEALFWRRANQHAPSAPESGL